MTVGGKSTMNKSNHIDSHNESNIWPETRTNFLSRWTFSFLNPLLSRGARKTMVMDDLWNVPNELNAPLLLEKFNALPSDLSFLRKLWRIISPCFVPGGFFQLVAVGCQCSLPILGRQIVQLMEEYPSNVAQQGIFYAFLIITVVSINGIANQRQLFLAMKSGMMARTTVVGAIYSTSLKLSPQGKLGLTNGYVTNLVAVDSQKLYEVVQDGHLIWSCPLSMIIVMILLIYIQGPVSIIGMLVLILTVPIVKSIIHKMEKARKIRVKYSDARIQTTTAMINGIQVTKLNSYEKKFEKKISEERRLETKYLERELFIWAWTLILTVLSPVLATGATFIVYVLLDERNILSASDTFATLMLFSALRIPINFAGRLVGRLGQSRQASKRIASFLSREIITQGNEWKPLKEKNTNAKDTFDHSPQIKLMSDQVMKVHNGIFNIYSHTSKDNDTETKIKNSSNDRKVAFCLKGIDFSLCRGNILAVVGPVGSGKSTLAMSLLGEIPGSPETSIQLSNRIGYAGQLPFILNATVRENITFGLSFDEERYNQVIEACCLISDIELFPAGDMTEIGERGVTLSGGQKQRLSIARTVYAKPDVAIFDDPLSALDSGTSRAICDRLFMSKDKNSLLSSTGVILVTHSAHFLHLVDKILVLDDGNKVFYGSWNELLLDREAHKNNFVGSLTRDIQEKGASNAIDDMDSNTQKVKQALGANVLKSDSNGGELMTVEEREAGVSSISTWKIWFRGAGGFTFVLFQVITLFIDRSAYVATEWWLAQWSDAANGAILVFGKRMPSQLDGREAQINYITIYLIIIGISIIATIMRSIWAVMGGARCAKKLFNNMAISVLQAKMSYFETTPLGRILNRFTYDVEVLDIKLSQSMSITIIAMSWFIAAVSVMTAILPYMILVIIPVTFCYVYVQYFFRKSGIDLQRLDSVSRSPLQTMLSEVMDGAITIRVFGQAQNFTDKFFHSLNCNNSAMLTFIAAQRWLGLRFELLTGIVVFCVVLLLSILQSSSTLAPGLAGMLVIWATNLTLTLYYLMESSAESEAAITSVERINAMLSLPRERIKGNIATPTGWPHSGGLKFENVCMRYRSDLPYALNRLSLELPSGKRCGVVGRTGAGKSSLAVALFRLVEIESGKILLDGLDLSRLDLSEIRGRSGCMSIIPQDPVLFSGSVRECLDPFCERPDEVLMDALNAVRLLKPGRGLDALDDHVAEGGSNYSVGERQLLCMARALIAKPKFLVLDEATASIDGETDAFIQSMLRTRFEGCTLLTIAHRLNTIMDYDIVIAMDKGQVIEMGSPKSLLENEDGIFSKLVNATGEESAMALRSLVA